jgi:hypothetical protein
MRKAKPTSPASPDASLDSSEALRDELDLKKVPELKQMARDLGLPVSGRKRDLVDRIVDKQTGGSTPEKANPGKPDVAVTLASLTSYDNPPTRDEAHAMLAPLSKAELAAMARELQVPHVQDLNMKQLREIIVETTAGRRVDSIAGRNFAGARPDEKTTFDQGKAQAKDVLDDNSLAREALMASDEFGGDAAFRAIAHRQGFDGLPRVVDRDEFERLAQGRPVIYRAVSATETDAGAMTAAELQEQMRTGPSVPGTGHYGSGFYFGNNEEDVTEYYGDRTPGSTVRAVLKSNARAVDFDAINADWERFKADRDAVDGYDPARSVYGADLGRYAAARGFDVIETDDGIFVVLNRTALIVEEPKRDLVDRIVAAGGVGPKGETRPRRRTSALTDGPAQTSVQVSHHADLTAMSDDELADMFAEESARSRPSVRQLHRIYDEMGRREERQPDSPEQERIDELVGQGRDPRSAYAEVYDLDEDQLTREDLASRVDQERMPGETRERAVRRLYEETVRIAYLQAEQATNGHMLSPAGRAAGINVESLFSGPRARARKYASEELKRWWEVHPRQTYTEFRAMMLGRDTDKAAAKKISQQGQEQDFGL